MIWPFIKTVGIKKLKKNIAKKYNILISQNTKKTYVYYLNMSYNEASNNGDYSTLNFYVNIYCLKAL